MVKHRLIDLGESESAIDDNHSPPAYLRFLVRRTKTVYIRGVPGKAA